MSPTKEKILLAALKLFAEKGYSRVTTQDIAGEVEIKAPSLYKHFHSKEAILAGCQEYFFMRIKEVHERLGMPDSISDLPDYSQATFDQIKEWSLDLFDFYLLDPIAGNFRRILLIERFAFSNFNKIYQDIFLQQPIELYTKIFDDLIQKKKFRAMEPCMLAIAFYAPIYLLMQKYDSTTSPIQEGHQELSHHIQFFCQTYQLQYIQD